MKRGLLVAGVAVVALGGAVAALALGGRLIPSQPASKPTLPPATAEVTRTTLVETKTVSGTLGYGDPVPVNARAAGTLTWIAPVGSTVERGAPLFSIDERPVVALYGSVPMYRTLRVGTEVMQGADVKQLQENLAELGYEGIAADGVYTAATAQAVGRWQADLGLPTTATVEPGQVVFVPVPVRIAEQRARVGDLLGDRGAPVLAYTGTTRLVTVQLDINERALAATGRGVTVTVPGVGRLEGTIAQIGTVVTSSPDEGPEPGGTGSSTADARIEVTVSIADQAALGAIDASPVDVDFVSDERRDVLAVPVAALLALPAGGYGVEIVEGDATRVVPVEIGMFAGGQVEVSGADIAEGMRVGVPK
ncbi:MAG: peptidoglycan-binding domain-containing protein [Chloroflexota bacterium]